MYYRENYLYIIVYISNCIVLSKVELFLFIIDIFSMKIRTIMNNLYLQNIIIVNGRFHINIL